MSPTLHEGQPRLDMGTEVSTAAAGVGTTPAVVLIDTKFAVNASRALRNCAAYGVGQLWIAGDRWAEGWVSPKGKARPPREERMQNYKAVRVYRCDQPLRAFQGHGTPIAIEITRNAIPIASYEFPPDPVFVFGPEDGSIPEGVRHACHAFVVLPTRSCVNLADAVGQTLITWHLWKQRNGLEPIRPSYNMLDEQRGWLNADERLERA
jgi:tRNA(Leu) C34 or U34 (ribose-2'-O)-methylase TrmL